jgi:carotenoid cleavage dioxygenase-like enzyme
VAFVPDRKPSSPAWVHDFGATPRHVVIIEHPLYMNLSSLLVNAPATHTFSAWARVCVAGGVCVRVAAPRRVGAPSARLTPAACCVPCPVCVPLPAQ